jgi:streptomycin 6-kinase
VVLKVAPRGTPDDAQLASEAATLAFWRPTGAAVELLSERDEGFTLLLEHALPGHSLDQTSLSWDEKLVALGRLARRLHAAGTPRSTVVPMSAYAKGWLAEAELGELLRPGPEDVLVHCDLHPGNALRAGATWKAVDPHGARGDRHAEIWALICPEAPALPQTRSEANQVAWRRLRTYSDAAGLDPERAALWTRVRAGAEARSSDVVGDPAWAKRLQRMAHALEPD